MNIKSHKKCVEFICYFPLAARSARYFLHFLFFLNIMCMACGLMCYEQQRQKPAVENIVKILLNSQYVRAVRSALF